MCTDEPVEAGEPGQAAGAAHLSSTLDERFGCPDDVGGVGSLAPLLVGGRGRGLEQCCGVRRKDVHGRLSDCVLPPRRNEVRVVPDAGERRHQPARRQSDAAATQVAPWECEDAPWVLRRSGRGGGQCCEKLPVLVLDPLGEGWKHPVGVDASGVGQQGVLSRPRREQALSQADKVDGVEVVADAVSHRSDVYADAGTPHPVQVGVHLELDELAQRDERDGRVQRVERWERPEHSLDGVRDAELFLG